MVAMAGRCECVSTTSVVSYFVTRGGGAAGGGAFCGVTTTCVPGCGAGCGACCTSTVVEGGGGACWGCDCTVVVVPGGTSTVVWAKAGAATSAHASTASLLAVMESPRDVRVRDHADDPDGHEQAGTSRTAHGGRAGG